LSERQLEATIAIGGGILAIALVTFGFMVHTWGVSGTIWRLVGLVAIVGIGCLTWSNRRNMAAYFEKRRKEAEARAALAAAAMAAAEARRPKPLRGQFPAEMTFLGVQTPLATDHGILNDPLTYVAACSTPAVNEPSLIVAELPVTPIKHIHLEPLPYWPSYSQASSDQRAVYIHWLINGRKHLPPEIGYAFMFFYGLERRALVDQADHNVIIDEILRLRKLNAQSRQPNRSFDSYTGSFLWFLAVAFARSVEETTIKMLAESTRIWTEENFSAALGWCAQTGKGMPASLALKLAGQLPGSRHSIVTDRVGQQFRELFLRRYAETYRRGLSVNSSKRRRAYLYKAASAALRTVRYSAGPNPMGMMSQFKPLSDLWNSCLDDLRQFSSVVRRESQEQMMRAVSAAPPEEILSVRGHPLADDVRKLKAERETQDQLTPDAWEALPAEIRAGIDHPLTDDVCKLVQECTDEAGRTLIPVPKLAALFQLGHKERYTTTESTRICRTVEYVGYCLEPDARLSGRTYRNDDVVTAFLKTTDEDTYMARYRAASCMLRLGMVVAAADGEVRPDEMTVLLQDLEQMFELNDHERRRLEVLRTLITATGPDLTGLSQMAQFLKPEQREAIAKLLLALAAKDGEVTRDEIKAIRTCYKTLGFDQTDIGHALSSLRISERDEEPVTVRPGTAFTIGEAIPVQPRKPVMLRLNRAAIARIIADTQDVARMLAEAMYPGEELRQTSFAEPFVSLHVAAMFPSPMLPALPPPPVSDIPVQPQPATISQASSSDVVVVSALPPPYASFYQLLISKQEWDLKEIDGLARRQGLMLNGAIDALNEWAAEKYGGQLFVEDGPRLYVEQAYLS
jgi:uncharacterized tellurite resistance protein B-like protein